MPKSASGTRDIKTNYNTRTSSPSRPESGGGGGRPEPKMSSRPPGSEQRSSIPTPRQNPLSDTSRFRYPGSQSRDKFVRGVDPGVLSRAVSTQADFGKPVTITSGHRNPFTNERVGGVKKSQHITGNALDFAIDDKIGDDTARLIDAAKRRGFTGIGAYRPGKIHADLGPERIWGPTTRAASIDRLPASIQTALRSPTVIAAADEPRRSNILDTTKPYLKTGINAIQDIAGGALDLVKNIAPRRADAAPMPRPKPPVSGALGYNPLDNAIQPSRREDIEVWGPEYDLDPSIAGRLSKPRQIDAREDIEVWGPDYPRDPSINGRLFGDTITSTSSPKVQAPYSDIFNKVARETIKNQLSGVTDIARIPPVGSTHYKNPSRYDPLSGYADVDRPRSRALGADIYGDQDGIRNLIQPDSVTEVADVPDWQPMINQPKRQVTPPPASVHQNFKPLHPAILGGLKKGVNMIPGAINPFLGLANTGAGLFKKSAGDLLVNDYNRMLHMPPEQYQQYLKDRAMREGLEQRRSNERGGRSAELGVINSPIPTATTPPPATTQPAFRSPMFAGLPSNFETYGQGPSHRYYL